MLEYCRCTLFAVFKLIIEKLNGSLSSARRHHIHFSDEALRVDQLCTEDVHVVHGGKGIYIYRNNWICPVRGWQSRQLACDGCSFCVLFPSPIANYKNRFGAEWRPEGESSVMSRCEPECIIHRQTRSKLLTDSLQFSMTHISSARKFGKYSVFFSRPLFVRICDEWAVLCIFPFQF